MRQIKFIMVAMLIVALFGNTVLAIEPLQEELPPDVGADAEIGTGEDLEEAEDIVTKQTNVTIERIHATKAKVNETIEIKLKVVNLDAEEDNVSIIETHMPGIEYTDMIDIEIMHYEAFEVLYYIWETVLPAEGSEEIIYHIRVRKVGMITLPPATVSDEYGNVFESSPTDIEITCNPNGKCDPGENYIFCPEDCTTGSSDGICNDMADNICDPDCLPEADPDCGITEPAEEEAPDTVEEEGEEGGEFPTEYLIGMIIVVILLVILLKKKK